jgi:hypothetical protein
MANQKIWGAIAEFENPARLVESIEKVRTSGYSKFEAWSPFPIHGIEDAMDLPGSKVPWITLAGGLTGLTIAFLLQWWTAAVDYPIVIGGKPLFAWEPSVPIFFELTVLLSGIMTLVGLMLLNGMPKPYHPLDKYAPFRRVTDDKFFITIEATDPKFDAEACQTLLADLGGQNVALVEE